MQSIRQRNSDLSKSGSMQPAPRGASKSKKKIKFKPPDTSQVDYSTVWDDATKQQYFRYQRKVDKLRKQGVKESEIPQFQLKPAANFTKNSKKKNGFQTVSQGPRRQSNHNGKSQTGSQTPRAPSLKKAKPSMTPTPKKQEKIQIPTAAQFLKELANLSKNKQTPGQQKEEKKINLSKIKPDTVDSTSSTSSPSPSPKKKKQGTSTPGATQVQKPMQISVEKSKQKKKSPRKKYLSSKDTTSEQRSTSDRSQGDQSQLQDKVEALKVEDLKDMKARFEDKLVDQQVTMKKHIVYSIPGNLGFLQKSYEDKYLQPEPIQQDEKLEERQVGQMKVFVKKDIKPFNLNPDVFNITEAFSKNLGAMLKKHKAVHFVVDPKYRNKCKQIPQVHKQEEQDVIDEQLKEYIKAGMIRKVKRGEQIYGRVCMNAVFKPDQKVRLVMDAREINQFFVPPHVNMPTILHPLTHDTNGAYFFKIDFSEAFMHMPLSEELQKWFGLRINGEDYVWTRMGFGWNMAPAVFQIFTTALVKHFKTEFKDLALWGFSDDLLGMVRDKKRCQLIIDHIVKTCNHYGIKVNMLKSVLKPERQVEWLGFQFTQDGICLTDKVKGEIKNRFELFKSKKTYKHLLSILGYLQWATQIYKYLSPMLSGLQQMVPTDIRIDVTKHSGAIPTEYYGLYKEQLTQLVNQCEKAKQWSPKIYENTYTVYTDASKSYYGFYCRTDPMQIKIEDNLNYDISYHEMMPIYQVLLQAPEKCNLIIKTDSQNAHYSIIKGSSSCEQNRGLISKIWKLAYDKQIAFITQKIKGSENPADLPSRKELKKQPGWQEFFIPNTNDSEKLSMYQYKRYLQNVGTFEYRSETQIILSLIGNKQKSTPAFDMLLDNIIECMPLFTGHAAWVTSAAYLKYVASMGEVDADSAKKILRVEQLLKKANIISDDDIKKARIEKRFTERDFVKRLTQKIPYHLKQLQVAFPSLYGSDKPMNKMVPNFKGLVDNQISPLFPSEQKAIRKMINLCDVGEEIEEESKENTDISMQDEQSSFKDRSDRSSEDDDDPKDDDGDPEVDPLRDMNLKEAERSVMGLTQKLRQANNRIEQLQDDFNMKDLECHSLKQEYKKLEEKYQELLEEEKEVIETVYVNTGLNEEDVANRISQVRVEAEQQIAEREDIIAEYLIVINEHKEKAKQDKSESLDAKFRIRELEIAIKQMNEELKEKDSKIEEAKFEQSKAEIASRSIIEELKSKLSQEVSSHEETRKMTSVIDSKNEKLEQQQKQSKAEIEHLKKEVEKHLRDLKKETSLKNAASEALKKNQEELKQSEINSQTQLEQLNSAKSELENKSREAIKLEQQTKTLTDRLNKLNDELSKVLQEQKSTDSELEKQLKKSREEWHQESEARAQLQKQLLQKEEEVKSEIRKAKSSEDEFLIKTKALEQQVNELDQRSKAYLENNKKLDESILDLEKVKTELETKVSQLTIDLEKSNNKQNALNAMATDLQQKLKDANQREVELSKDHQDLMTVQQAIDTFLFECGSKFENVGKVSKQLTDIAIQNKSHQNAKEQLESAQEQLKFNAEHINALKDDLANLKLQVKSKEAEIKGKEQKIKDLEQLKSKVIKQEEQISATKQNVSRLEEANRVLSDVSRTEKQLRIEVQNRHHRMEDELKSCSETLVVTENQRKTIQWELDKLNEEMKIMIANRDSHGSLLKQERDKFLELLTRCTQAEQELQRSQFELQQYKKLETVVSDFQNGWKENLQRKCEVMIQQLTAGLSLDAKVRDGYNYYQQQVVEWQQRAINHELDKQHYQVQLQIANNTSSVVDKYRQYYQESVQALQQNNVKQAMLLVHLGHQLRTTYLDKCWSKEQLRFYKQLVAYYHQYIHLIFKSMQDYFNDRTPLSLAKISARVSHAATIVQPQENTDKLLPEVNEEELRNWSTQFDWTDMNIPNLPDPEQEGRVIELPPLELRMHDGAVKPEVPQIIVNYADPQTPEGFIPEDIIEDYEKKYQAEVKMIYEQMKKATPGNTADSQQLELGATPKAEGWQQLMPGSMQLQT